MKYLLLLLITFNVFAEVKVTITKNGVLAFDPAPFIDQIEADAYITDNEKILKGRRFRNSFGLIDRWLKHDNGNSVESREIIVPPVLNEDNDVMIEGSSYFEYKYLQNYVITSKDITVQMDQERSDEAERVTKRRAIKNLDLTKLKKKPTESVAEYRDRHYLLLEKIFTRLIRDRYGKKQE